MFIQSSSLKRQVQVDFYMPEAVAAPVEAHLLLFNDGQELCKMDFGSIMGGLLASRSIQPLVCIGIHAGQDRMNEYGTMGVSDFAGRGAKADSYVRFIMEELLPAIYAQCDGYIFKSVSIAGFSLGALSAMDIGWKYSQTFSRLGLFSGSFWWRAKDKEDPAFNERRDRIMQRKVAEGNYQPGLRFFFECGTDDEAEDRNGNGIIDSIDDTMALMDELVKKGYDRERDIRYVEVPGGRHEVGTWARVMPEFLIWGWGK
ncbi:MAG TPA: alpha/beta hydrolase-fold protein [Puia sp.]